MANLPPQSAYPIDKISAMRRDQLAIAAAGSSSSNTTCQSTVPWRCWR